MVIGRTLQKALEKFFKSPVVQDARCQVLLPSGEFLALTGAKLLENKIIGSKETHRLVFLCEKEKLPKFRGIGLKSVVYSALPIYWVMLLVSTFLHWS